MESFATIYERALSRKGEEALRERLPHHKTPAELRATSDDRYLSTLALCVFAAGFRWRVVQAKWPGFEEAFEGFDPEVVSAFSGPRIDALRNDTRIVRNPQKIYATISNARFVLEVSGEHGGFGAFLAEWPQDDLIGLWDYLKQRGSRLGGDTGPRFLRHVGRDTFILTPDVSYGLALQGIISGSATSKKALNAAQDAFFQWRDESGRSLGELSVILACSVDRPQ